MTKKIPLLFSAYLTCILYFCVFHFSWFLLGFLALNLALTIYRNYWKILLILPLFLCYFLFVKHNQEVQEKAPLSTIHEIRPVADTIQVNGSSLSFVGQENHHKFQVYYNLTSEPEQQFFKNLDNNCLVKFDGNTEYPEVQRNFNGYNQRENLAAQNIYQIVQIKTLKTVQTNSSFDLHLLRRKAILYCQNHFPAPMNSYMTGLLFGYLGKDFSEMNNIYTSLGIIHLFALSGMQVNFFVDWLRKILLRLGMTKENFRLFQIPFSIFYAFITGLSFPVLRALLQKNIPLKGSENFAATFFVLLLISPKFLLTASGNLTMIYAFVIMILSSKFQHLTGLKKLLMEGTVISLGGLPLLIFYFHSFQPASIPLTIIFSALFDSIILPILLLSFLLSNLTGIQLTFFNELFKVLENLVKFTDDIFHYPLILGRPNQILLLILLLLTGLLIDSIYRKKHRILLICSFLIILIIIKNPVNPSITMVDIGQGDSFLLEDKWNKKTILIDTGGKVSFGKPQNWQLKNSSANADFTLIPYLKSRGISHLDDVILTHTDDDHVGDFADLADQIKIRHVWISPGCLTNSAFIQKLKTAKVAVHVVKIGDKIPIFDSQLSVLSNGFTGQGDNNDSIVTYGKFYGKSFLFTGDLEKSGEADLLKNYPDLTVDVLKAGHHGSKTSSSDEFIKAIKPQIALISVGQNNRYGHPNHETLDTFNKYGVKIYRTDQEGAVRFDEIDGKWKIKTVK